MRFVKRKSSSSSRRSRGPVSLAALLGLVLSALALGHSLGGAAYLRKIEPSLLQAIEEGPVVVYVSADRPMGGASKVWEIGDVYISKMAVATKDALLSLARREGVISIWGPLSFSPPLSSTEGDYDLEVDVKWRVHKSSTLWIGRGVVVCIIDTGIDYLHPDFFDADNRTAIEIMVSVVFETADGRPVVWIPGVNGTLEEAYAFALSLLAEYNETAFLDLNGHGTHVAGIVAGRGWASRGKYRGLAFGCRLVIVKAFRREGFATMDDVLDALDWVEENVDEWDIDVLSLSWGSPGLSDGTDPVSLACDEIAERGVFVFAAAGNPGNWPTTVMIPACAHLVYAVGAWDGYKEEIAPFSALGPTADYRMKPDFLGCGVMVVSTASGQAEYSYRVGDYYAAMSGTSMATPCVAAVCADFIEYFRYWHGRNPTRAEWEEFAIAHSMKINPVWKDFVSGWGIPRSP